MASSDADEAHVSKAQGEGAAPIKAAALSRQVHCVAFERKQRARPGESVSEFRVENQGGPVDLQKWVQWTLIIQAQWA